MRLVVFPAKTMRARQQVRVILIVWRDKSIMKLIGDMGIFMNYLCSNMFSLKTVLGARSRAFLAAIALFLLPVMMANNAWGDDVIVGQENLPASTNNIVNTIEVSGNIRVDKETIKDYLAIKAGVPYDSSAVDSSLKALYATDLFSDVNIKVVGNKLLVTVVEDPIVNDIIFEGNVIIASDMLSQGLSLAPNKTFSRARVQADVQAMILMYRRQGRFAAVIEPQIVMQSQNRVDIIYEISEGDVTTIAGINFIGNEKFSRSDLLSVITSEESQWYKFWSSNDIYDPDRLNYDQELLRKFYLSSGYYDFKILSVASDLTQARDRFFITFSIEEGNKFSFGTSTIESAVKDLKADELNGFIKTFTGEVYDGNKIEQTIEILSDEAGKLGYAFVAIVPEEKKNQELMQIDLVYRINETPRVYIEAIEIEGNTRTSDEVIRREFRLAEGDPFDISKKKRTIDKLNSLGYFSSVDIKDRAGSAADKVILQTNVTEQATGSIGFNIGYGTGGALGILKYTENNLLGRGQTLSISDSLSGNTNTVELSFVEPRFMGKNLGLGVDLYDTYSNYQSTSQYSIGRIGANLSLSFRLRDYLGVRLGYLVHNDTVEDVASSASSAVQQASGGHLTSAISYLLSYDRRNSIMRPTNGYIATIGNELAGVGGDVFYIKTNVSAARYYPITDNITFKMSGRLGSITGLHQNIMIVNSYNVSGDELRGFQDQGIGPRAKVSKNALGGKNMALASAEVNFPIGFSSDYDIKGGVFTDMGTLFGTDYQIDGDIYGQDAQLRLSVGAAIYWLSPIGPISISLSQPLVKEDYDFTQSFRFGYRTSL